MAPVFLTLILGSVELGYALNASNTMYGVVREGGRLASQDFTNTLASGQSANDKVIQDIKNMLTAARIPGDKATVTIEDAENPGTPFNLQAKSNYLKMFRIEVTVAYEDVTSISGHFLAGQQMKAGITFRLGRVAQAN